MESNYIIDKESKTVVLNSLFIFHFVRDRSNLSGHWDLNPESHDCPPLAGTRTPESKFLFRAAGNRTQSTPSRRVCTTGILQPGFSILT